MLVNEATSWADVNCLLVGNALFTCEKIAPGTPLRTFYGADYDRSHVAGWKRPREGKAKKKWPTHFPTKDLLAVYVLHLHELLEHSGEGATKALLALHNLPEWQGIQEEEEEQKWLAGEGLDPCDRVACADCGSFGKKDLVRVTPCDMCQHGLCPACTSAQEGYTRKRVFADVGGRSALVKVHLCKGCETKGPSINYVKSTNWTSGSQEERGMTADLSAAEATREPGSPPPSPCTMAWL